VLKAQWVVLNKSMLSSYSFSFCIRSFLCITPDDPLFAAQIDEVLGRIEEVQEELQSFAKHHQYMRENTWGEHEELVHSASITIVQQKVAFLTRLKVRQLVVAADKLVFVSQCAN
jgi:hypothetical protein